MGAEDERWMATLNERFDECAATLDRERMALELVFRRTDGDGEWRCWVPVRGEGGVSVEDSPHAIDRDHLELGRRCKEPGWEDAEPAAPRARSGAGGDPRLGAAAGLRVRRRASARRR